ncbi:MAG: hypothetical protein LLP51_02635 [Halorhodospira halophila]|uniref:hypothetical protein n=1 Tax=Halorhodospira TaxID=85108 RepID=UPI001912D0E9|nr:MULTISPECIES: hypothetical protein [Halorhodospira]MBK5937019.1 hypothetical protein [Halorhodospira halophila]MBK5943763.1 hypothetical protein [Halorhodospira halophila]MCC3750278.1 hypothetical protein [Halorhodospira halophila]MCG5528392.1 hypothetical protein [Halorhodospira halophila]MCG5537152.1 hypothetical protein [Halorhodospira sp. 9622]
MHDESGDNALERATLEAVRRMAAAFADPLLAPLDAGADGVAQRYQAEGDAQAGTEYVLALTSVAGCRVEVRIPRSDLLALEGSGVVHAVYQTLVRECGAHLAERETLIVTTRGRPGPGQLLSVYRRRLG